MDGPRLRRKVILDLLSAPAVLLPTGAGLTLLLATWATGQGGAMLAFSGAAGLLIGAGSLVSRWLLGSDAIVKRAMERLSAEDDQRREAALDDLSRRLARNRDGRDDKLLADLRTLMRKLHAGMELQQGEVPRVAPELMGRMEELSKSCIMSLERSLQLWESAQQMTTKAGRQSVLDARERIIDEVQRSVSQIAQAFDGLQTISLGTEGDSNLVRARVELNESLEVARRVEERMRSLEQDLGGRRDATRDRAKE